MDGYQTVEGYKDFYVTRAGYLMTGIDDRGGTNWPYTNTSNPEKLHFVYNWYNIGYEKIYTNTIYTQSYKEYFRQAINFTEWFNYYIGKKYGTGEYAYLNINSTNNDPEDPNSPFNQHKKQVIKQKIEEVLNSSITAYAKRTGINYKMPKFLEEDWEKIYNNISVISLVQGMNLGFKNYNNYCILNSTNSNEYVNPNLIYFTDGNGEYHDIRCKKLEEATTITGYKIGDFEKQTKEVTNADGTTKKEYYYSHDETACYECINGSVKTTNSVYDYVRDSGTDENIRRAYFTALAKERYNTTKLLSHYNDR